VDNSVGESAYTEDRDDLAQFIQKAVRGPKRGAYEDNLIHHLALGLRAPPLRKVRLISEAVFYLDPKDTERMGLDVEEARVLSSLARAFEQATVKLYFVRGEIFSFAFVPFSFPPTEESFKKYLAPWLRGGFECYDYRQIPGFEWMERVDTLSRRGDREAAALLMTYRIFYLLGEKGLKTVRSQFLDWAIPKAMRWASAISKSVSHQSYVEAMRDYNSLRKETSREDLVDKEQ